MNRGFTLVEALVSIAITVIAGSVLLLGTTGLPQLLPIFSLSKQP
jgi:type II secretory pathway pseudopilin PulG